MVNQNMISKEEATRQVRQMGQMFAALYYYFSKEIIAELGIENGEKLIQRAVWNYGTERGIAHKDKVIEAGFENHPWNYVKISDLPGLGWDVHKVEGTDNPTHMVIEYCPFAEYWKEKGFNQIGRIYCTVDQAKYQAFNEESDFIHLRNTLDQGSCCEMKCLIKDFNAGE